MNGANTGTNDGRDESRVKTEENNKFLPILRLRHTGLNGTVDLIVKHGTVLCQCQVEEENQHHIYKCQM